jgi:hypothetical protein
MLVLRRQTQLEKNIVNTDALKRIIVNLERELGGENSNDEPRRVKKDSP